MELTVGGSSLCLVLQHPGTSRSLSGRPSASPALLRVSRSPAALGASLGDSSQPKGRGRRAAHTSSRVPGCHATGSPVLPARAAQHPTCAAQHPARTARVRAGSAPGRQDRGKSGVRPRATQSPLQGSRRTASSHSGDAASQEAQPEPAAAGRQEPCRSHSLRARGRCAARVPAGHGAATRRAGLAAPPARRGDPPAHGSPACPRQPFPD